MTHVAVYVAYAISRQYEIATAGTNVRLAAQATCIGAADRLAGKRRTATVGKLLGLKQFFYCLAGGRSQSMGCRIIDVVLAVVTLNCVNDRLGQTGAPSQIGNAESELAANLI